MEPNNPGQTLGVRPTSKGMKKHDKAAIYGQMRLGETAVFVSKM